MEALLVKLLPLRLIADWVPELPNKQHGRRYRQELEDDAIVGPAQASRAGRRG